ncbi:WW domain protein [Gregarina niphandrodes]|uniref:WW domain protein n=1 Tax=Gregarina niphandrodes TaxID=110365 RepID=A0A023B6H7_GRENI|nr:WW domain protein [Gregarina niphandrodes]EZG66546.1 WW domain protein [Gregarina niphandrodes]|eukprot:XP_011130616.1 WW domain protein [Gregarina niphandrodes]
MAADAGQNNPPSTPTNSRQPPTPGSASASGAASQEPEWKEYTTAEGRVFWHNSRTGRSTWDKPEDFKSDFERLLSTSSAWKEYPQGDGRSYWHNSLTRESEWEVPAEVARIKESHTALDQEDWSQVKLDGKCDARAKFREFLERKCVGHLGQWDSIGRVLQKDPKWNVFNSLMTTGERKHVFNEHVNNLVKKNKEELRMKKAKARDSLAEYLWRWKSGEIPSLGKMAADTLFQDLEDNPEWRILDVRERFETFEETASAVAATAIQKCSTQKAEAITSWLKICRKGELISDDISLQDLIAFVRRYYDGDLEDVNDLSIIQQWKSLLSAVIQDSPPAKIQKLFAYEKQTRARYLNLLQICEQEGMLNAKTETSEFLCQPVPLSALDDTIPPIGLSDSIDLKRQQILTRLKTLATQWLEEHQKFDSVASDSHPLCVDNRYLALFLQGGSSAQELFTDFVYTLWDLYEVVRDAAKTKITNNELLTEEQVLEWIATLAPKYQRPGVITPLIQYCQKRLQQADGNSEKEKGEISSSS